MLFPVKLSKDSGWLAGMSPFHNTLGLICLSGLLIQNLPIHVVVRGRADPLILIGPVPVACVGLLIHGIDLLIIFNKLSSFILIFEDLVTDKSRIGAPR